PMNVIRITCAHCGKSLKVSGTPHMGKRFRCTRCRTEFKLQAEHLAAASVGTAAAGGETALEPPAPSKPAVPQALPYTPPAAALPAAPVPPVPVAAPFAPPPGAADGEEESEAVPRPPVWRVAAVFAGLILLLGGGLAAAIALGGKKDQ